MNIKIDRESYMKLYRHKIQNTNRRVAVIALHKQTKGLQKSLTSSLIMKH